MLPALTLLLLLSTADTVTADTLPPSAASLEREVPSLAGPLASVDTTRRRPRAVEVSDAYAVRLRIHRLGSFAMYPLFASETVAGRQIFTDPRNAPTWAKTTHRVAATGLALVFTSNTVTGLWNLWESRAAPQGRTRRTLHALLMLASDAGFTYAGARLSEQAETSLEKRREHRAWAYGSMATALAGVGVMLTGDRD